MTTLRVYRLPSDVRAHAVARGLGREGVATRAGVRHSFAYVAVRSERGDVDGLVRALEPLAVAVDVEHLPAPRRGDVPLF